jgi:hypothetical protein
MLNIIKQNKYVSYCIFSGLYGVARSFNGYYKPPDDALGNRMVLSLLNGFFYSLYAPYYSIKLLNRIDIKLKEKDQQKYIDSYTDQFYHNMNVFI